MPKPDGTLGIVLAAGAGRRMGGPKALIGPLAQDGVTPLERVCGWVHEGGCEQVFAVIGAQADSVRAALNPPSWLTLVEANNWDDGMGASLRTGLDAAASTAAPAALVTLVDLPDVRGQIYRRIREVTADSSTILARATFNGRPGHPVVLGRDWWDEARRLAQGDRGARDLFAAHEHLLIECGDLGSGRDVDTPEIAPGTP